MRYTVKILVSSKLISPSTWTFSTSRMYANIWFTLLEYNHECLDLTQNVGLIFCQWGSNTWVEFPCLRNYVNFVWCFICFANLRPFSVYNLWLILAMCFFINPKVVGVLDLDWPVTVFDTLMYSLNEAMWVSNRVLYILLRVWSSTPYIAFNDSTVFIACSQNSSTSPPTTLSQSLEMLISTISCLIICAVVPLYFGYFGFVPE